MSTILDSVDGMGDGTEGEGEAALFHLPYRLVFAVAATNSVLLYCTDKAQPLALLGGLHYAPITDLAWYALRQLHHDVIIILAVIVIKTKWVRGDGS